MKVVSQIQKKVIKAALEGGLLVLDTNIDNIETQNYLYEIDFFGRPLEIELFLLINNKESAYSNQGFDRKKILLMNIKEVEGQEIFLGIPVNNYIDFLLLVRSQEFYKDKYLTCTDVTVQGRQKYGVTRENFNIDTKLVTFIDND